jgi:hypothetical protein
MATKISKPPKQLYVVSKNTPEYEYPVAGDWQNRVEVPHNFGFLHPHEPHLKGDASRKETQLGWAYSRQTLYKVGEQFWVKGHEYDYSTRQNVQFDRPLEPEYWPRVWDNVPLTGFRIIDTVNRSRGNKLLKVLDPRGVEFEITVKSLFTLLMEGEVKHGEIMSPCVWQTNKNLVVVN